MVNEGGYRLTSLAVLVTAMVGRFLHHQISSVRFAETILKLQMSFAVRGTSVSFHGRVGAWHEQRANSRGNYHKSNNAYHKDRSDQVHRLPYIERREPYV